jgi:hypothetical protein
MFDHEKNVILSGTLSIAPRVCVYDELNGRGSLLPPDARSTARPLASGFQPMIPFPHRLRV